DGKGGVGVGVGGERRQQRVCVSARAVGQNQLASGQALDRRSQRRVWSKRRMIDLVDEIEEVVGFHAVLGHEPPHRSAVTLVVVFLYAERLLVGDLEVAGDVVANALVHLLPEVEMMRIKRVIEIENPGFHMAERARRGTSRTHDTDAWSLMTLRSGRSNARMMRAAIRAMPAIIRKNIILSMLDQKLPSHPAIKLPAKLVASQTPISIETIRTGAIFDTSESPIGDR